MNAAPTRPDCPESSQPLSKSIPPEALTDPLHPAWQPDAPFDDPFEQTPPPRDDPDPEYDDSWDEPDLDHQPTQRFDLPSPIQLEARGITSQATDHSWRARNPAAQSEFWTSHTVQKNSIAAKLRLMGDVNRARTLEACHSTWTVATCNDCGRVQKFPNRCDNFFCPECMPRLSHEREESITWWCNEVKQPKFVTLTCRNINDLTTAHIQEFKGWWNRLRRRKFARGWRGGFYSLEVTNRGRGWHLHLHALIDAQWIDAGQLRGEWCDITGGLGEIVKVKDARTKDYLVKVKSYIVKPEQLAAWTPDQIETFIQAFDGCRTFGVFGSLYGKRTEFAAWIKALKESKPRCPCGSCNVRYQSEADAMFNDLCPNQPTATRPPPPPDDKDLFLSGKGDATTQPR